MNEDNNVAYTAHGLWGAVIDYVASRRPLLAEWIKCATADGISELHLHVHFPADREIVYRAVLRANVPLLEFALSQVTGRNMRLHLHLEPGVPSEHRSPLHSIELSGAQVSVDPKTGNTVYSWPRKPHIVERVFDAIDNAVRNGVQTRYLLLGPKEFDELATYCSAKARKENGFYFQNRLVLGMMTPGVFCGVVYSEGISNV